MPVIGLLSSHYIPATFLFYFPNLTQLSMKDLSPCCQQGLMESCIVAKTAALSTALRRVLYGFHSQKAQSRVDAMLLRLYEPILFRSLASANNAIRCNAFNLLFEAFPIQVVLHSHCPTLQFLFPVKLSDP